jgi:GNAT superfamily N-acetyltransferase
VNFRRHINLFRPSLIRAFSAHSDFLQKEETAPTLPLVASTSMSWTVSTGVKTSENFEIRPARVEDVPIILQLIRDLATYERAPNDVTATEEQLVDVLFGERPAAELLLAFEGQSPVGFAVYFYNFSTWLGRAGLYLEDLFVNPDKRGKGYGRALLVELAKIARDRESGRMEWAVLDWNEPAIKFYRALGAKPMHEWTVFRLTRDGIARLAGAADTAATTEQREHD